MREQVRSIPTPGVYGVSGGRADETRAGSHRRTREPWRESRDPAPDDPFPNVFADARPGQ